MKRSKYNTYPKKERPTILIFVEVGTNSRHQKWTLGWRTHQETTRSPPKEYGHSTDYEWVSDLLPGVV